MRIVFCFIIIIFPVLLSGQAVELVYAKNISAFSGRSYLYKMEVKFLPGFLVNAANSEFSCKYEHIINQPATLDKNFIRTEIILAKGIVQESQIANLPRNKKSTTYQYMDGTGRSLQTVNVEGSPSANDHVSFILYDTFARQPKVYLPYTLENNFGAYRADAQSSQSSFYKPASTTRPVGVAADNAPFSINIFDDSPMNNIRQSYGAGWDWQPVAGNKPIKHILRVNGFSEVRRWTYTGSPLPQATSYYAPNSLLISESINEAGLISKTYTDFKGQVILERRGNGTVWLDTYHVYDVAGNLCYVLPPEATNRIFQSPSEYSGKTASEQQAFMDLWAFQYRYDEYSRLTDKRVPGAGWVFMIYDSWDRPVLVQDSMQRVSNKWTFTKYDNLNRPVMTGLTTGSRAALRTTAKNSSMRFEIFAGNASGYTNRTFPTHSENDLLTVTYYDNYNFRSNPGWDSDGINFGFVSEAGFEPAYFDSLKGYTTGSKIRVLGSDKWLNSITYYDRQYQVIQTISEIHLGGTERVSTLHDFDGTKLAKRITQTSTLGSTTVLEEFLYDHARRMVSVYHQINTGPKVLMTANKYNELGQVIEKNIHSLNNGASFLQSIDSRYNIRGWITSINNSSLTNDGLNNNDTGDLFGMEIVFNQTQTLIADGNNAQFSTIKMYDGNIAAIRWKTDTREAGVTPLEKIYGFSYDQFSRFRGSVYATKNGTSWNGTPGYYNEVINRYDGNGNIGGANAVALSRNGLSNNTKASIDNLTYTYSGNQVKNVVDNANNSLGFSGKPGIPSSFAGYIYDGNGNLKEDFNKDIGNIIYNHLNQPVSIEFKRTGNKVDRIEFVYDALGNKLSRTVRVNGTAGTPGTQVWKTDFAGPLQYDNGKISFLNTTEGRAVYNGTTFDYEYFFEDHQGNVRLAFGAWKETISFKATMEMAMATEEENLVKGFRNVAARRINPGDVTLNYTAQSTKTSNPDRSAKCNANASMIVGPAKSLRVLPGDAVYMEVFAKYTQTTGNNAVITAATLGAAVNLAFNISSSAEAILYNAINTRAALATGTIPAGNIQPKAYLAFLFFDDNYVFQRSGAIGITSSAYNGFEKLIRSFTAEKSGYLYIYVASESNAPTANVYFDDFYIIHQKNTPTLQVSQASDYYPFGLAFNEYNVDRLKTVSTSPENSYEPMLRNRYRFQGEELQRDLNLGWYHYKYRMHDPALGRFISTDPLAEQFKYNSTYAFSENRLVDAVELEGLEASKAIYETMKYFSPVAFKINFNEGSHRRGIGFDVSIGIPKVFPFSYRKSYGASFYSHDAIQEKSVIEKRTATETSYFGLFSVQSTSYESKGTSQTTGTVTIGNPLVNIQYENDWFSEGITSVIDPMGFHPKNLGDGGDRYRTAALQLRIGLFNTGFNLATGDPGLVKRMTEKIAHGKSVYINSLDGDDPDKFRMGTGYLGIGNFRFGINNEFIRRRIQNNFAHDMITGSPWFRPLPSNDELYLEYSTGTGTQW